MRRPRIALVLALLAVAVVGVQIRPAAGVVERPNIVLIVTDDQRWDTVRGVMSTVETELLARGIEFRNTFATNPLCCPSRATILTGLYAHSHGVYGNYNGPDGGFEAFDDSSTIATWLDDSGYRTALIGKYMNGYQVTEGTYVPPGWDEWFVLMDGDYYDISVSDNGLARHYPVSYSTDLFALEAETWIDEAPAEEPLFLMFNPRAPHGPYTPATRHATVFDDRLPYRPPNWQEHTIGDKPRYLQAIEPAGDVRVRFYDREQNDSLESLLAVDEAVGRILDALEQSQRLENTLIVFTSDNGYQWGEHRLWGKNVPYDASLRVPLIMRWDARIAPGVATSTVAANIDLAPTLAQVAGISPPVPVDGLSLMPFFSDAAAAFPRKGVLIEHGQGGKVPAYCGFRTAGELFVRYRTGEEEYYRYSKDPYELENSAYIPSARRSVDRLRAATHARCLPLPPNMIWD